MFLRKTVENSFTLAVMSLALSGVAVGQVAGLGAGDSNVPRAAGVDTKATADEAALQADGAASANVKSNDPANPGAKINDAQADVNAAANANRQNINSNVRSNTDAGVNAGQNRANASQNSNGATNTNPFGATFDSSTSDRLIIQDLQPNSAASRLGLQAGDRIIGFNGQTYTDVNQFERDLNQLNGNSDVPFIYERNGQRFTQSFRMSANESQQFNGQQRQGSSNYGNQGWNGQSGPLGQGSHSANRPIYGVSSQNEYSGGMHQGQGNLDGTGWSGSGSNHGAVCCSGTMQAQESYYGGHRQHRQHSGGRRHRNGCR